MFLEGADKAGGQHGHSILHAFAIVHDDLTLGTVEIFDAKPQTFHQPQAATIQQFRHESWRSGETLDDRESLLLGQHRRQAFGRFRTHGIAGEVERHLEHVTIQTQQGAERLIVGRRRHLLIDSQVRQKRLDGCTSQLVRRCLVMEENIACDPRDVGFFWTNRLVLEPDGIADLVKQSLRTVFQGYHLT
jgi:hypothetical protein